MTPLATFISIFLVATAIFTPATYAQTLASGYLTYPDTCSVNGANEPLIKAFALVSSTPALTSYIALPHDTFNSTNATAVALGKVFVPNTILFPFPYCGQMFQYDLPTTTAGCDGLIFYGVQSIIADGNTTDGLNFDSPWWPADYTKIVLWRDISPAFATIGTLEWERPATCAPTNVNFQLNLTMTGLFDTYNTNSYAVKILDDQGLQRRCTVLGNNCYPTHRPNSAATFDPKPGVYPVCRQVLPFDPSFSVVDYDVLFGSLTARAPSNVPVNSVVYQVRLDNLPDPGAVKTYVLFRYVNGSGPPSIVQYFASRFGTVQYTFSAGVSPAVVSATYYNLNNGAAVVPPNSFVNVTILNEYATGFLPSCLCGVNVICDANNFSMNASVPRSQVPGFIDSPTVSLAPTCSIVVNDGKPVVLGVTFSLYGIPLLGAGGYTYIWQLAPELGSVAHLFGFNTQQVNAVISSMTNATVDLYITSGGFTSRCSALFTVRSGTPTAVVVPGPNVAMNLSTVLTLDASGSISPDNTPLMYSWTVVFSDPQTHATITNGNSPVITFAVNATGLYVVSVNVTNIHGTSAANVQVTVFNTTAPAVPSAPGTSPSNPFVSPVCIVSTPTPPSPAVPPTPPLPPLGPTGPTPAVQPPTIPFLPPIGISPSAATGTITIIGVILGVVVAALLGTVIWKVCREGREIQDQQLVLKHLTEEVYIMEEETSGSGTA